MHVAQLLDPLAFAPHIEIVKAPLPHALLLLWPQLSLSGLSPLFAQQMPRIPLFEHLHHRRGRAPLRFADQQMNVFWHDYVAHHHERVSLPNFFKNPQE